MQPYMTSWLNPWNGCEIFQYHHVGYDRYCLKYYRFHHITYNFFFPTSFYDKYPITAFDGLIMKSWKRAKCKLGSLWKFDGQLARFIKHHKYHILVEYLWLIVRNRRGITVSNTACPNLQGLGLTLSDLLSLHFAPFSLASCTLWWHGHQMH